MPPSGVRSPTRGETARVTDEFRTRMVEFLPRLRRFAVALTGDLDQGDDLVQETCLRALSRVDQWQPGTRLDSWMYRIAQNLWLDRTRARKYRSELSDPEVVEAVPGQDGRNVVEGRLTLEAVLDAMTELSPEQQVLVALVCIDGASYKEAAEITGTPIGTVMSRLARARRELHERLEPSPPASRARPQPDMPAETRFTATKAGTRL
jgi:RNA polymerase sigma-70 factor, ECF subfamily